MRLAIISDVHGNLRALEAVLADIAPRAPDVTVNLGVTQDFSLMGWKGLTARFDIINLFDQTYEIRDGTGVGVGAPQFGARRGFLVGLSKTL